LNTSQATFGPLFSLCRQLTPEGNVDQAATVTSC